MERGGILKMVTLSVLLQRVSSGDSILLSNNYIVIGRPSNCIHVFAKAKPTSIKVIIFMENVVVSVIVFVSSP